MPRRNRVPHSTRTATTIRQLGRRLRGPWEVDPNGGPVVVRVRVRKPNGWTLAYAASLDPAEVSALAIS